jgi:hypothetical protein
MIGSPTNFQHTGHIGSGDVDTGNSRLRAIQNQMQSKGGYETAFSTVQVTRWGGLCKFKREMGWQYYDLFNENGMAGWFMEVAEDYV